MDGDDFDPTDPFWVVMNSPLESLSDEQREQRRIIESLFLHGYERTHLNECLSIS